MALLLKADEVAEQLGVERETLARWRESGCGPNWLKLGEDGIRYIDDDVLEWVEQQARSNDPALRVERVVIQRALFYEDRAAD